MKLLINRDFLSFVSFPFLQQPVVTVDSTRFTILKSHVQLAQRIYVPYIDFRTKTKDATCVWRNIESRSCNRCCGGKSIGCYILCVCVPLGIQHVMRMRQYYYCLCHVLPYHFFPTLSHKRHILGKLLNIKSAFWFFVQLLSDHFSFWGEMNWGFFFNMYSACSITLSNTTCTGSF